MPNTRSYCGKGRIRSEREIRKMIDRIDEKIEEDPFYNNVFASKESSPLYFAKLALKWVLGER